MPNPDLDIFTELAARARLIPVYREVVADLDTPLTIFAKLAATDSHAFLFESLEGGEKWGRYSFIGYDPILTFTSRQEEMEIIRAGVREKLHGDPLAALKELLASFDAAVSDALPRFFGGLVGYLGYDMVRFMEEMPQVNPPLELPDSSFMVPRIVLIHDSFKQKLIIVNCVTVPEDTRPEELYVQAIMKIDEVVARLREPLPYSFVESRAENLRDHEFTSNMDEETFRDMVRKAKEYIVAGDIIQVVLSQRFHTRTDLSPFALYRALRHINPSPYLFYLKLGDVIQIGSSPEILVRLDNNEIEVRPIAGTRHRGATPDEDLALEKELLADPKERAEHLMLVDLGRNDAGRVAEYGSVEVRDLLIIERYSHVMHIVSGVHGRLAAGKDQFDVMKACFPAGTVSGAPKIRAMEIIEELEPERRGPYAGAVGYFGFSGNMDFCITIRTFVLYKDNLYVQAGAGIVADSDPQKEYEETLNKARGLRRALELAEEGF